MCCVVALCVCGQRKSPPAFAGGLGIKADALRLVGEVKVRVESPKLGRKTMGVSPSGVTARRQLTICALRNQLGVCPAMILSNIRLNDHTGWPRLTLRGKVAFKARGAGEATWENLRAKKSLPRGGPNSKGMAAGVHRPAVLLEVGR